MGIALKPGGKKRVKGAKKGGDFVLFRLPSGSCSFYHYN